MPRKMLTLRKSIRWAFSPSLFAKEALEFEADDWQKEALEYPGERLILLCSRQTGKTTITAVKALHRVLFTPGCLVLVLSPSQRQSQELFRKVAKLVEMLSDAPKKVEDNKLSMSLANGSRIVSLPSTETTVRGFSSPDLVIIDEAARVTNELYYSVRPMLATSSGQLILLSTPAGRQGFFFDAWENEKEWRKIKITAQDCKRITPAFLQEELSTLGRWFYSQEYECEFVEGEHSMFRYDDVLKAFTPEVKSLNLWGDQNV